MRVLIIDDDPGVRRSISLILEEEGYEVLTASDGEEGLETALDAGPDLVLCDVRMPKLPGLEFLDAYREADGEGLVIMITAYGSTDLAIEAMKRGAYDYLAKPFSADEALLVLRKAEEREQLHREVTRLREQVSLERRYSGIVARSSAMEDAVALAEKVARHPSTVLVTGESGTGKELIARLVHDLSPRKGAAFIPVNCGAIPENLLESELFGHVKGAFTGASSDRAGLFEEAHGGTLFLDEIGELPQNLQVKLLRALQEGEVRRVGSSRTSRVDVRVVAATARDLERLVKEGEFRSELYYRINVVRIHLSPLRHRSEDIPPLCRHFVAKFNRILDMRKKGFDAEAMKRLLDYSWPGNVRELENFVERAMVLSEDEEIGGELVAGLLPSAEGGLDQALEVLSPDELSVKKHTARLERRLITRALQITEGNRTKASELLDLSYRALLYKIKDYELDV
ncbi:MAG TPA: sigma-54 dependent transcriptional regulator [Gemmatimonadota bacterium]|nr:sigma-54 dependent transcriptional regulator [Gemmatimonadota bacterium]